MSSNQETPFKVHVADEAIQKLKQKLALTTFPDELENVGRDFGTPLADVKRLVARWRDGYDWRKHEAEINQLPQFKRTIAVDGFGDFDLHYVHKKSKIAGAIPLLFVHGWPGSFLEVKKILPLLTEPEDPSHPSFHVVTFSLPGYGFSSASKKPGFNVQKYGEVGHKLMLALGYSEYVTQGGDWGGHITKRIALDYGGKHSKAWHTNYPRAAKFPGSYTPKNDVEKAGFERSEWFHNQGRGYQYIQGTQPQTLGYGLADSPAGLLAWIYEKLVNWSDNFPWEDDEVLTWVSIYWFSTAGPAASLRIYYERGHEKVDEDALSPTIPMGFSYFPKEIYVFPSSLMQDPHLVFEGFHESGGHFAAHEKPVELVGDLRKMFGKHGPAYGVVPGKDGYEGEGSQL